MNGDPVIGRCHACGSDLFAGREHTCLLPAMNRHTGYGCRCTECEAQEEAERNSVPRLRSALAAVTEKLESLPADWHTYATCVNGESVNADRGCVLCEAHAALRDTEP